MPELDLTTPEVTEQAPTAPTVEEETLETPAPAPEQPEAEQQAPEPEQTPVPEEPDYKQKFRNSSSEALILNAQVKQKDSLLNKLTSQDAPNEAEILQEYPDYNQFDANSKKFVTDLLTTKKRQTRIDLQLAQGEADRQWQKDLQSITANPKYAPLAGNKAFESFVLQPKHRGLDMETLADAYMMRTGQAPIDTKPKVVQKQELLPTGTGPKGTPRKAKLSIEEATVLRQTNYKEYTRLLNTGLIETDV